MAEQLPEFTVHGDPVNEPVESVVVKETVPEPPPLTVAVQVVDDPAVNDGHDTDKEAAAAKEVNPKRTKNNTCRKILFFLIKLPAHLWYK